MAEGYELELTLENGGFSFINGKKYPIVKNNFICIKPGTVRHTEFPFRTLFIKFTTDSEWLSRELNSLSPCFPLSDSEKVRALFDELLSLYNTESSQLMICSKFTELLHVLKKESAFSGNKSLFVTERAKLYMTEHLSEKITLEDISRHVHFNSIYFHRIFKKETGTTPSEYLSLLRIENAKKELARQTNLSVRSHSTADLSLLPILEAFLRKERDLLRLLTEKLRATDICRHKK